MCHILLLAKDIATQKGTGYGEEFIRLNRAENLYKAAIDLGRKHPSHISSALVTPLDSLLRECVRLKASIEHELRVVYLEAIPADSSVVAVACISLVKFPDFAAENSPPLFEQIQSLYPDYVFPEKNKTTLLSSLIPKDVTLLVSCYRNSLGECFLLTEVSCLLNYVCLYGR